MYINKEQARAFLQQVQKYETIIIHRHQRPDPDALGSQLGLKAVIQAAFPSKLVLAAGTTSQGLQWMGEMDQVKAATYEGALVIVCDTANRPRIDGAYFDKGHSLIKIDHHPSVDPYGDLQLVFPQASSTCEILVDLLEYLTDSLPLNTHAARMFYTGLIGDTGRFLYQATSSYTHQVAAKLLTFPIEASQLGYQLIRMTQAEAKFQAFALANLQRHPNGVASLVITQADIVSHGITEEQTQGIVPLPGQIEGITSWVIFVEQVASAYQYRCRIRSSGPQINQIAERYDGGGHPLASGANVYSPEEMNELLQDLIENAKQKSH